ncbi:hypothetical protein V1477_013090 [Vespula maculifrons]|uniref:Uncharacterized protein n=1 Tax=Vespula maculifrons TaxID=7453 RepID=A0ABD2BUY5_VESMC
MNSDHYCKKIVTSVLTKFIPMKPEKLTSFFKSYVMCFYNVNIYEKEHANYNGANFVVLIYCTCTV